MGTMDFSRQLPCTWIPIKLGESPRPPHHVDLSRGQPALREHQRALQPLRRYSSSFLFLKMPTWEGSGGTAMRRCMYFELTVFSRKDLETERDQITFDGKFKYLHISQMRALKYIRAAMGNKGSDILATLGFSVQSSILEHNDLPLGWP